MLISSHFAAAARVCIASGFGAGLLLIAGCAGLVPQVPVPAANPDAGATTAPARSVLGQDEVTRKTEQLLAASGANRLEGLKPMKHGMSMEGMDHAGMKETMTMPGMDHSKMPEMQRQPRSGTPAAEQPHEGMHGMDHSKMPGMEHSHMPERRKAQAPGAPTGKQQPSSMQGMDHSKMPGMQHEGATQAPSQPKPTPGASPGHGAHSNHGGEHSAPSTPVAKP